MSAVMIASWNETTLPNLLSNYKLENVFNADEFGLFYQHLPTKTYHLQAQLGKATHVCCWKIQSTTML